MILALESSCDETAVALFDPRRGLVGEWLHTQMALHERHGGVVPDLATREHVRQFAPLLARARAETGFEGVTAVAVTQGPGLAACLAIGVAAAKALAVALRVPVLGVNHLRAHVLSPFIALHAGAPADFERRYAALLPHLALVVSGGNTMLCALEGDRRITVISSTRDDAAGEALDKGAKLLGLGYPGGPLIEKLAAAGRVDAYDFPRGIGRRDELDFSFSGLKTSLRYTIEKLTPAEVEARRPDLCASYQQAVIDALLRKTRAALATRRFASLGLSGGVANNRTLRAAAAKLAADRRLPLLAAEPAHTGDNAGMIAFAAWSDRTGVDRTAGWGLGVNPSLAVDTEPVSR
ncbi:MAG: tRNA (adenosine(37)-N6)-threonylcarbamoyltransferase complex transferase subunit TsaD [Opitutaceae bacterium]|nr:tRNA (adenosine(37)-N6)-threonylcarbamoyltransferase complex transferase subunit TsaD [Opitutaceae bacterium]